MWDMPGIVREQQEATMAGKAQQCVTKGDLIREGWLGNGVGCEVGEKGCCALGLGFL